MLKKDHIASSDPAFIWLNRIINKCGTLS